MSGLSMPIGAEDREEARSLGRLRQRLVHLEGQVRALDAGVDDHGVSEPERVDDVVQHVGGGGRSEREDRRAPEPLRGVAEAEVGRAEVVAPLRHAVRLVDDEQRGAAGGQRVEELRVLQALGGDVHELGAALANVVDGVALLRRAQRRVQLGGVDACLLQLVLLVLHEGDQR
jgi:hypothetical protein